MSIHDLPALWVAAALLTACATVNPAPEHVPGFAIYLVQPGITAQQMRTMDLDALELESAPILALNDILAYTWETHTIELSEPARERIAGLEVPVTSGLPFVACVGDERIYAGAFWVSYSSMSFDGVVIDTLFAQMEDGSIRIQLGYPASPEFFVGADPRSDPRILQSLREAGKLSIAQTNP
jgi:hypothetical protein